MTAEGSDDVLVTADPEVGAREVCRMPIVQCGECGVYYWDSAVADRLKSIGRDDSLSAIDEAVRGSECPECGAKQVRA